MTMTADDAKTEFPLSGFAIFDVDTHVSEPPDLWTARMSAKWGDAIPRLVLDPDTNRERWLVGKHMLTSVARHAVAGWREPYPASPPSLEEAHPAAADPVERLKHMDRDGIAAAVIYPNLLGFQVWAFLKLDPALRLDIVRAFNDWQLDFCSVDPTRLVCLMYLPWWDVEASVKELDRCAGLGFRGVMFGTQPERLGFPPMKDDYWHPLLARAQEAELSLNFHVAFSDRTEEEMTGAFGLNDMREMAKITALNLLGNAAGIAEVIMSGICERYPTLRFVSVESGFGYVPYLLEALDWQYLNMGGREQRAGTLLPSEYFRRQVYSTFWFETGVERLVDLYPDNVMFETDFPHPTSLSIPQAGSIAKGTQGTVRDNLAAVPDDIKRKILYDNAARLYRLDR